MSQRQNLDAVRREFTARRWTARRRSTIEPRVMALTASPVTRQQSQWRAEFESAERFLTFCDP
jgi:hypothetical protein